MKANFANIAPRMAAIAVAAMADTGKPTHTRKYIYHGLAVTPVQKPPKGCRND